MVDTATKEKKLACESCKRRKKKCDFKTPCSLCVKLQIQCSPRTHDKRSEKFNNSYVRSLEAQVKMLKNLLEKQQQTTTVTENRDFDASVEDLPSDSSRMQCLPSDKLNQIQDYQIIADVTKKGSVSIYGPSSVYIPSVSPKPSAIQTPSRYQEPLDFENLHSNWILKCISNFFKWRYPDTHVFIQRESFLTDFFKEKDDLKTSLPFCTEELVYGICALSADIEYESEVSLNAENDQKVIESSLDFYNMARDLVFEKLRNGNIDSDPSTIGVTVMQTLLCLAFYDLGRGDNTSCWLLSGIAFRIGQNMGLEFDPTNWKLNNDDGEIDAFSEYDIGFKNRIYWGCYLADNFIDLVLGRSHTLQLSNTTIVDPDDLPGLKGIQSFTYYDPLIKENYDFVLDMKGGLKCRIELYALCERYQSKIFSVRTQNTMSKLKRIEELGNFNLELQNWKISLPSRYTWTISDLKNEGHNPVLMMPRWQYYLSLLCFNRPFITERVELDIGKPEDQIIKSSRELSLNCIHELYLAFNRFKSQENTSHGSLFIVYNTILSIMVLLSILSRDDYRSINIPFSDKELISSHSFSRRYLSFFVNLLGDLSHTWVIAKKYYQIIQKKAALFEDNITTSTDETTISALDESNTLQTQSNETNEPNINLGLNDNNYAINLPDSLPIFDDLDTLTDLLKDFTKETDIFSKYTTEN